MSEPSDPRTVTVTLTKQQLEDLHDYAEWHGGAHAEDCPGDDTCDCIGRPLNDAINRICLVGFDAFAAAPALARSPETETHRCSGCGLRWMGTQSGAELCGDCWRRGQSAIHAPALAREPLQALMERWRAKADQSVAITSTLVLCACASELDALLSSPSPAPREDGAS